MIINKIELINYRSHEDTQVVFDRGINLLLGKNGSGKTSVLEALGFALLNIPAREGGKDTYAFRRKGTDSSSIKLEFTGNDCQKYTIIRNMKSNNSIKLYRGDELIADNVGETVLKMKEIAKINGDEKSVFSNIITAAQNEIVSVFKQTPGDRRKLFNEIFEIDIYDDMSNNFCKSYVRKLNDDTTYYNGQSSQIEPQVKEIPEKKNELKEHEEKLPPLEKTIEKLDSEKKKIDKEVEKTDKLKNEKGTKEQIKELKEESLKKEEGNHSELLEELEKAQKSREIVKENLLHHKEYVDLRKKEEIQAEAESKLLKDEKEYLKLDKEISSVNEKIKNGEENRKALAEEIKYFKEKGFSDYFSRYSFNKKETEKNNKEVSEIDEELLKELLEKNEELNTEIEEKISQTTFKKTQKEELLKEVSLENSINEELEETVQKLEELEKRDKTISQALKVKENLNYEFKNLTNSKENLTGGLCPLLNEECLNIKEKGDPESYFKPKLNMIKAEIEKIKFSEHDREENSKNIIDLREKIINKKNILKQIEQNKKKIFEINIEQKEIESRHKEINNSLGKILENFEIKNSENIKIEELDLPEKNRETVKGISRLIRDEQQKIKLIEHKSKDLINKKEEILKDIKKRGKEILNKHHRHEAIEKKLISLKKEIKGKTEIFNSLGENHKKLQDIRNQLDKIRKNIKEITQNETLYINNLHNSNRVEELSDKTKKSQESIEEKQKELKIIEEEIKDLTSEIEKMKYDDLRENAEKIDEELKTKREERAALVSEIKNLKIEYKALKEKERELKEIKQKIRVIEDKYVLLKDFRDNLKKLGQKIAKRFRDDISSRATDNYNRISGLEEKIIWDETYGIKILSPIDNQIREFANLSGGEQVAVALCVRAALASLFSNAKIAIFDEPTQNLDRETREKLSETLNLLFKDLEQTFIVTHENDFTEMAVKTIHFEKIDGKTVVEYR